MLDKLIRFSLTHRLLVLSTGVVIASYGLFILKSMPVDVFPDLNRPTINILTEAPGMAPEEVETLVTLPLETVLNGLPGIQRLRSSSGIGLSVIYIEFDWDSEIYRNRQLVAERLSMVKEKLPPGITPTMGPIASIMGEIQLLGLTSNNNNSEPSLNPIEIRTIADWVIRPRLLSLPGMAQVIAIGGGVKQIQIQLSAEKIQKLQLSMEDIEKALSGLSRNSTGGYLDLDKKEYLIRNIGMIQDTEDILTSVVGSHLGRPVLIKDIGSVKIGSQTKRGDGSINGHPAVILSLQKQPGANTIELTRKIEIALKELEKSLPKNLVLHKELFKQSNFIESAIKNIKEALFDGTLFVFIILFIFLLNIKATLITLTAIPMSFLMTAITLKFFGISINTMTLGGLAIAIGELVDDAIVDVENILRRLKENKLLKTPKSTLQTIYEASSEVRNSIIFATIIVVLVFIPLFYMSGIEGRLFIPLGVAYVVSLLCSLLVSLTITPVLCSFLFFKTHEKTHKDSRFVTLIKSLDKKLLEKVLDQPKLVIGSSLILLIATLLLIPKIGKDFLPKFNEGTATLTLVTQPGTSLEESNRIGTRAEKLLLTIPEIKSVARRTGRAEMDEHAEGVHYSEIDIDFNHDGRNRTLVLEEIRKIIESIPGTFANIGQPISHRLDHLLSGVRAQIAMKIFGPNLSTLRNKASEVFKAIQSTPGLVDLQVEQQTLVPQIKIQFLRDEAARYGIVLGDLSDTLETALNGRIVATVLESQRMVNIFVRFDETSRSNLDLIKKIHLKVMPDGTPVTLDKIADVFETKGPNIINRENSQRRMIVSANTSGESLGGIIQEIRKKIDEQIKWPEGYFIQYGGQFESQEAASKLILFLGFLSLIGIFMVLYAHFNSIFIAIQIMLNIPMALIGSLLAIYLTSQTFSVATMVAFVTLCGIASRNGIMMISHYLHLMKNEGETFTKNMIIRGSLERLVPVLMTTLTAILGLVPLVFAGGEPGKEILHPVAIVIVGGLISSTALDMILTPTIFYQFGKKSADKSINHKTFKLNELSST